MVTSAWLPRAAFRGRAGRTPRRTRSEEFDDAAEEFCAAMQMSDCQAESGFQAGDPEGGALELDILFWGAWGACRWHRVDRSVRERRQDRLAVRAERSGGFILKLVS